MLGQRDSEVRRGSPKPITIRDVARLAGVGVGTVSRVLNGGAKVNPLTRDWVLAVIRHSGFRPNAGARRILRHRAGMVCFLLSNRDFLHSFHARILQGVENYASALKQHVVFAALHYSEKTPPESIPLPPILEERGWVDGLILAGTIYPNFLERVRAIHLPYVVFGNNVIADGRLRSFDQVCFDGAKAEAEATRYLIEQGHRLIAFVGDVSYPWMRDREKGYLSAMRAANLPPLSFTESHGGGFREYGERMTARIIAAVPRPTAVVAGNDEVAYGLWQALARAGVRVPEQISLVGFDDREEALLTDPTLTTVRVHKEEIGRALMKLLLEKLRQPGARAVKRLVRTELVVRNSVRRLE